MKTYDINIYWPYTFITIWECDPRYTFPQDQYTTGQMFALTPPVIPQQAEE
jgi:hypothetical protein